MRKSVVAGGLLSLALLLGSCGSPVTTSAQTQASYARLLTVHVDATMRAQDLEQRTGGKIVIFKPEAGFAVVGLASSRSALQAQAAAGGQVEGNARAFHSSGKALWTDGKALWAEGKALWAEGKALWAEGKALWAEGKALWAEGKALWADGKALWAEGQYVALPQNTEAFQQVHLETAQNAAPQLGAGVTVAVIDSGMDLGNTAFQGVIDTADMHDFVDGDSQPQEVGQVGQDPYGHGTGVAGVIRQIAPNARIMPLRVINSDDDGDVANVASAIVWAVDHGAQIVNLSLGSDSDSPAVNAALDYAASHGVLAVMAAGNEGHEGLNYPAASLSAGSARRQTSLSVGSVAAGDLKSDFSNYASDLNLSAPGEGILTPGPEGYFITWSGTSFSTPMAAGALALALGEHPNASGLAAAVIASGQNIDGVNGNAAYTHKLGVRLDVAQMLSRLQNP